MLSVNLEKNTASVTRHGKKLYGKVRKVYQKIQSGVQKYTEGMSTEIREE